MCNIAGYVGEKRAAPILIQMIRKQEGLDGGFYTGISTHNGAYIDYHKKKGELSTLLSETDAEALEGNMGIAHSRTPSGGDSSWSHPFVTERDGRVKLSYVANGALGLFKDRNDEYSKIADRLVADGFDIPCKLRLSGNAYNRLSSGENVHMSDVMCQLIYYHKQGCANTAEAMTEAFCEMPGIIVGLAIEEESPDRIFFSRINMPMFVGFDAQGAYLATSPIAFPESVKSYELLPPLSSGVVFKDRYEVRGYENFRTPLELFGEETVAFAEGIVLDVLKKEQSGFPELRKELLKHLPQGVITQENAIIYMALSRLLEKGKILALHTRRAVGADTAPKINFELREEKS